jgi:hypothetical protein
MAVSVPPAKLGGKVALFSSAVFTDDAVGLAVRMCAGKKVLPINSELWHACAGLLVSPPPVGSLVVYFPQGHGEQVNSL